MKLSYWILLAAIMLCVVHLYHVIKMRAPRNDTPTSRTQQEPSTSHSCDIDPSSLLVLKNYSTGRVRTATAKSEHSESIDKKETIFATQEPPALKLWSDLCVQPTIGEDGELEEPQQPTKQGVAELKDPEIAAALRDLEVGEQVVVGDMTEEERVAVAHFDLRSYR